MSFKGVYYFGRWVEDIRAVVGGGGRGGVDNLLSYLGTCLIVICSLDCRQLSAFLVIQHEARVAGGL